MEYYCVVSSLVGQTHACLYASCISRLLGCPLLNNIVSALGISISDSLSGIHDMFHLPSNRSRLLKSRKKESQRPRYAITELSGSSRSTDGWPHTVLYRIQSPGTIRRGTVRTLAQQGCMHLPSHSQMWNSMHVIRGESSATYDRRVDEAVQKCEWVGNLLRELLA
jgi:hypothetical protein